MYDFGDELTIQSYRIPWLIWIQILIMFLLILILFCFSSSSGSLFALDLSAASASASASSDSHLDKMPVFNHTSRLVSTRFQGSQVGEEQDIKGEIAPGSIKAIIRAAEEMEDCSGNRIFYHPCHYLKLAFLKCLGLDSSSETTEQRNQR